MQIIRLNNSQKDFTNSNFVRGLQTQTEKKTEGVNGANFGQLSLSVQLMSTRIENIKHRFK